MCLDSVSWDSLAVHQWSSANPRSPPPYVWFRDAISVIDLLSYPLAALSFWSESWSLGTASPEYSDTPCTLHSAERFPSAITLQSCGSSHSNSWTPSACAGSHYQFSVSYSRLQDGNSLPAAHGACLWVRLVWQVRWVIDCSTCYKATRSFSEYRQQYPKVVQIFRFKFQTVDDLVMVGTIDLTMVRGVRFECLHWLLQYKIILNLYY